MDPVTLIVVWCQALQDVKDATIEASQDYCATVLHQDQLSLHCPAYNHSYKYSCPLEFENYYAAVVKFLRRHDCSHRLHPPVGWTAAAGSLTLSI